jgi:hypothetical protein
MSQALTPDGKSDGNNVGNYPLAGGTFTHVAILSMTSAMR